jgi:hypothetical protein
LKKDILQEREQQLRWYGHVTLCWLQKGTHRWKRRSDRTVSTWKVGIRDSRRKGKLWDEKFFHQKLWRQENHVFRLRKTAYSQGISYKHHR